ncbi:MAG TPA: class II aldolase/adducin family protein [Rhizomicrobium sp.]|nr:class II aldolase/adducin family protein [Rhizomicrobium sp.]
MSGRSEESLRHGIIDAMRLMIARGLNRGTTGNVSARSGDGMLVTPTGVVPEKLTPQSIVYLDAHGRGRDGELKPSSEWRMHARILARRPDVNGIVHCHSRYATILACAGKAIPPLHYMVGVSGKPEIPLAPYATFGSVELADHVADALAGGYACLMANHGLIAAAPSLERALFVAEEIEEQAAVYWGTLAIGGPVTLTAGEMEDNFRQFRTYGQKK